MRRLICQRVCRDSLCCYESGGHYNIDPDYQLGKPFITTKLLFYDDVFHNAAESLFVGTAAGDIVGELLNQVGTSVFTERFSDLGDNSKNVSIRAGELHGDADILLQRSQFLLLKKSSTFCIAL